MRAPGSATAVDAADTTAATTAAALTPQQIADTVRVGMYAVDRATQSLGITIDAMAPGSATLRMTVRPDMLNGLAGCHGGLITTLADSAFAFACNSYNELTVASGLAIELMAPAREGDVLVAAASEVSRGGRLGLYDVVVTNQRGERVALMRGRSYTAKGKRTVELPDTAL
jgi:acyl-CoA thioesterase